MNKKQQFVRSALPKRSALVVALAMSMGFGGLAYGQATTGTIFGNAPQQAGDTVVITNSSGLTRTTTVRGGRYSFSNLPVGNYTVTLQQNGEKVSSHNVQVRVGGGAQADFVGGSGENAQELGAVEVSANALPAIDVSQTSTSTTFTSEQLAALPVGQDADAIALLAPSVTAGSNYFNGVSFGGAGITENAYYVNGFNTTGIYNAEGYAYTLPYGAIEQQQVQTHGYSAKYGRADGGIINQIGKSGSNEWHFGARIQWVPRSLRQSPKNRYYPSNITLDPGEEFVSDKQGQLQRARSYNKGWDQLYGAYIGGPLIKDKLFMFVAGETDHQQNRSVSSVSAAQDQRYKNRSQNIYGTIKWNLNDNNIFQYTFLKNDERNGNGSLYAFDNEKGVDGEYLGPLQFSEAHYRSDIFNWTSYIGDNGTLSAVYGRSRNRNPVTQSSDLPYISGLNAQNPALNGGQGINNAQTATTAGQPNPESKSRGLRVDFAYQLGEHKLSVGIDNIWFAAADEGTVRSGPGYVWIYHKGKPDNNILESLNVGAPGGDGYYVAQDKIIFDGKMSARQKAWYVQDEWQMTPDILLNVGLRNDRFDNYNAGGDAFISEKNQWEPRLGISWDVNGDGSFKLFANAGRYYLALPQAVANRQATPSTFTDEYFTYTGIDANGEPTGLKPVPTVDGDATGAGPVSKNGEYGTAPNPKTVASTNIKPQYQDEYMLGFDKKLGENWVYGANVVYRKLGTLIDDGCYPDAINNAIAAIGADPADYDVENNNCHLFNPGSTNVFHIAGVDGGPAIDVPVSNEQTGLPKPQREYYALNLHMEHPFDGTWFGRVDYTFSRSWGNSEGQVRSDIGQGDISATEDWDYKELMVGSRGYLANDVRHQIKAYGSWQITQEWMVSGQLQILSGRPTSCLGFYGTDPSDPSTNNPGSAYGPDYHWCRGQIATPGANRTPWTKELNLGITYRPNFADNKLAFKAYVFNVLGGSKPVQVDPSRMVDTQVVSDTYHMPLYYQTPRYVRFTVSYDY